MARTNHIGAMAAAAGTLVALGLVVLIMLVVVEADPAEATFPGKNGRIAFVRDFELALRKRGDARKRHQQRYQPVRSFLLS